MRAAETSSPLRTQASLVVGTAGDSSEEEADRVSAQVMRAPADKGEFACRCGGGCPRCRAGPPVGNVVRSGRVSAGGHRATPAPAIVHDVLRSPGQPLDPSTRAYFEPRFGQDFSRVRVHADARAAESARSVNARAYTVGQDVAFGRDQYSFRTAEGRHLIAHELAHTLQQRSGAPILRRAPPKSTPPETPNLEARLQVIEESGAAVGSRLDKILRTGPMPSTTDGAKVIGAAIVDVEGYKGATEIRAINGADTDALGRGAAIHHAETPKVRTLSQTQGAPTPKGGRGASIRGPRNESIFPHINDAEMKMFEEILSQLPENARGTIYFTTARIAKGQTALKPIQACSGCIRASFEAAGKAEGVDFVSHAPTFPTGIADLGGGSPHSEKPGQGERVQGEPVSPEPAGAPKSGAAPRAPESPPAAKPAVAEPPAPQLKVEASPVGGAVAEIGSASLGIEASRLAAAGRFLASEAPGLLIQAILMAIFPPNVRVHNDNYAAINAQKIEPALQAALREKAATLNKLAADDPTQSIWAAVTVKMDYLVKVRPNGLDVYLQDLHFIKMNIQREYLLVETKKFEIDDVKTVTYSVPIFGRATHGSETAIRRFRKVREDLTDESYKVRMSAMIAIARLAQADPFLQNQLRRDLQAMLNDDEPLVRKVAAGLLARLKPPR